MRAQFLPGIVKRRFGAFRTAETTWRSCSPRASTSLESRLGQYARRHLADGHAPDAAPDEIERPQWAAASVPDRPAAHSARSEPWSPDTHGTHDAICLLNSGNDSATGPARRATAFAAPSRASVSRELSVVATRQSTEKDPCAARCGKAGSSFSSS